jgi:rRNA maturation protein Rpf1
MRLDFYDDRPASMKRYLKYYGEHFNKKLCDFAVNKMDHGKAPVTKEKVDEIL